MQAPAAAPAPAAAEGELKRRCCECDGKRDEWRPVMRLVTGVVLWVCRQCWKALDYDRFMWPKGAAENERRLGF